MTKKCNKCSSFYPPENFIWDRRNAAGIVYAQVETKNCSFCRTDAWRAQSEWNKKNPTKHRDNWLRWAAKNRPRVLGEARKSKLKNKFGITEFEYEAMFSKQNGVCFICHGKGLANKRLSIDHDHKTGKIRGLLCHPCNIVLGLAKEDKLRLLKAVDYLEGFHNFGRLLNV